MFGRVAPKHSSLIKMDGSGRITRRNRRFLRKIIPFQQKQPAKLPLQQFYNDLVRDTAPVNNAATTAEQKSLPVSNPHTNTQTEIHMSDSDFNTGLTNAVQRV